LSIYKMKKALSIFIAFALLVTQILYPNSSLFAQTHNQIEVTERPSPSIPGELGQLKKVFFSRENFQKIYQRQGLLFALKELQNEALPFVVLVEDAHSSLEAQLKIAQLIRYIRETWNVRLVSLEGAEGEAPLDALETPADENAIQEVLDFYLEEALITGPEYAILQHPEDYIVYGAENMGLYEADRNYYLEVAQDRHEFGKILNRVEKALNQKKKDIYSPALLVFDKKERRFKENPGRFLGKFIPYLTQQAAKMGIHSSSDSLLAQLSEVLTNQSKFSQIELSQTFRKRLQSFQPQIVPGGH